MRWKNDEKEMPKPEMDRQEAASLAAGDLIRKKSEAGNSPFQMIFYQG